MDTKDSIKIVDRVYDKQKFLNSTDTEFRELINNTPSFEITITSLEDFFVIYNQIFFTIPKEGDLSHTTLVQQSGEYLGVNSGENFDIQTLLEEITTLRNEKVEDEALIIKLQDLIANK